MALSSVPDSFDPGNTYYAWVLDFDNLFTMPMFTYKSCPGSCGAQVVPDLATDLGTVSDKGLTWTFHIQPNVKFEDGTVVTTQDVKYAIERTYDRTVAANGPTYYQALLADPKYPGPYKDRAKNLMGLTSVQTPNATTIVFHLVAPFPDLPYVLAFPSSAPVPPAKDTGSNYQLHPISTGPFMFQSYQLNKQLTLVPNPQWNPATDPNAKQLPSKIVVNLNVNQADVDNRLLAGDIDVDAQGTGVAAAAQARILSSPTLKANADSAFTGRAWFAYLNTKVAPMSNLHCREAVEYAVNKVNVQTAWGGPVAGGAIASTLMPPVIAGYKSFDLYEALSKPTGDITAAKQQLAMCGQPNGFSTNLSYRSDRPKEVAAATAIQASLAQAGIKVTLKGFPSGSYYTNFAGAPAYVHSARHRHRHGRLVGRLAERVRLPRRARRREHHRGHRQLQRRRAQRSGDQQPVHQVEHAHRSRQDSDLVPDRHADHEGRRRAPDGVRQDADLPVAEPHQRLHMGPVRHVQLCRARCEVLT